VSFDLGATDSSQNLAVGVFSAAHFGQRLDSGLPHSAQNFLTPALSVPHFEQRIESPEDEANSPSYFESSPRSLLPLPGAG
jgi:hypothetical protein